MEKILTSSSSIKTNKKLHTYRLYLQVTFLSDITNLKEDTLRTTSLQEMRAKNITNNYA